MPHIRGDHPPSFNECHFDYPPIPNMVVCWHPESDDCFNVKGFGPTREEAYADMLDDLKQWEDEHATP